MKRVLFGLVSALLLAFVAALGAASWLLYANGGAHWLLGQVQARVPGDLRVERLEGSLADGLDIEGLRFVGDAADVGVAAGRLVVRVGLRPLSLHVRDLRIDGLRYRAVEGGPASEPLDSVELPVPVKIDRLAVNRFVLENAAGEPVFAGGLEARLAAFERLDIEYVRLTSGLGTLDVSGQVALAAPWTLELALAGDLELPVNEAGETVDTRFEGRLEGPLNEYALRGSGTLAGYPLGDPHRYAIEATGSTERLEIGALKLAGPAVELDTRALLDWGRQRLDLSDLRAGVPGSPLEANADLQLDFETGRIAGDVSWQAFSWPLRAEAPQVSSAAGRATIAGVLDDWTVDGRAELAAAGVPPAELQFAAAGDRHGLRAEIPVGAALGGTFGGRVAWSWEAQQPLTAALHFEDLETAPLLPGWPGRMNGELSLDGQLEPLAFAADVARLQGTLRDTPVAGEGRVAFSGSRFRFDGFAVRAGGSQATLQGDAHTAEGLAFELEVSDPGALLPGAAGRANGHGMISLAEATPRLTVELEGADLAWGEYRVDRLTLRNVPVADAAARSRLELQGSGLAWNGQRLDSADLVLDWSVAEQRLELALTQGSYRLAARAEGRPDDPRAPLADWRWGGALAAFELFESGQRRFALAAPAALAVSAQNARIDDACLESPAPARLCIEAGWDAASGVGGAVALDHFPLDVVAGRLGAGIEATQVISGRFAFSVPLGRAFSGDAELDLSPGAVRYVDDPDVALETAAGRIVFSMADGRLSAGRLDVPMPGQGGVELDFEVDRLAAGPDSPVSGRLRVELADLDVLTLLLPAVDRMAGSLEAEFDLTGTVGDPGLDGQVALTDGAVTNLASGFRLNDLQLSGEVDPDRQTRLTGSFRAVDGVGKLTAVLDLRTLYDPVVTLEVGGEDLVLFDTPTLELTATPDLRLGWRNGAVEIGGALTIPQGLVEPKVIPVRPVGVSEDVEIVAGTLPQQQTPAKSGPLDIRGSLDVTLGPNVRVKLPFVEASVSGTTRFAWSGGPIPTGNGAFEMSGKILALGQLLEITEGTVGFPDVRADNPHLNVHAERDIYGNSEIRRAGVLVTGTLRRPVIEPYTEPMTNRERARTLLVTGSDFNMERGVGTVDVGTYIAPKIFVSYGIGVFGQENVFSVRYDLGAGWGVKASSGESQTGVDMSFTVEN